VRSRHTDRVTPDPSAPAPQPSAVVRAFFWLYARPWGQVAITVGILVVSWLFAWVVGLTHWSLWLATSAPPGSETEQARLFMSSPWATIVPSLAFPGSTVWLTLRAARLGRQMDPIPEPSTAAALWLVRQPVPRHLAVLLVLGTLGVLYVWEWIDAAVHISALLPETSPLHDQMFADVATYQGLGAVAVVAVMSVGAGVSEELLCRGLLLPRLLTHWSAPASIMVSSAVFAAAHIDLAYVVEVFPSGVWFGYIAYRLRSTLLPITAHVLVDVYVIGWFALPSELRSSPTLGFLHTLIAIGSVLCIIPPIILLEQRANREKTLGHP
jgi:membrane protease YdiL (CAAX protease family)